MKARSLKPGRDQLKNVIDDCPAFAFHRITPRAIGPSSRLRPLPLYSRNSGSLLCMHTFHVLSKCGGLQSESVPCHAVCGVAYTPDSSLPEAAIIGSHHIRSGGISPRRLDVPCYLSCAHLFRDILRVHDHFH